MAASSVRIQARLVESGKVEFGLQFDGDEVWLPQARLFPYATATVGRWLYASPYTVAATEPSAASPNTPDPSGGTVIDGVYTPNDRTGGVIVWGVVPWDADFLAGYIEMFDFLDSCGFERRRGCDSPADTEILRQLATELYQCEISMDIGVTCVGFVGSVDQKLWDAKLACPEG